MATQLHSHHLKDAERRRLWARRVVSHLEDIGLRPKTIFDVGCGFGYFLSEAQESWPVQQLLGVDGPWVDPDLVAFPRASFRHVDLSVIDESGVLPSVESFEIPPSSQFQERYLTPDRALVRKSLVAGQGAL